MTGTAPRQLLCLPLEGLGEVTAGDDLAALVADAFPLEDGDVLVVTSKVVSKAEGRVRNGSRDELLAEETDRVVARRGPTSIVRTHHGLVVAAAGIDASNTETGTVVLLPRDPDASARALREALAARGSNVAVVVSDTAGRAWRQGQTDIAIGAAGLRVLDDHAGRTDPHGNQLAVTAPAVADELAAAGDLVKGKLGRRPAAVLRGVQDLVLGPGEHGPGARALVRPEHEDMFGLGAREAVVAALTGRHARGFGAASPARALREALDELEDVGEVADVAAQGEDEAVVEVALPAPPRRQGAAEARVLALAFALGWQAEPVEGGDRVRLRLRPASP